jgi:hypothetical protein
MVSPAGAKPVALFASRSSLFARKCKEVTVCHANAAHSLEKSRQHLPNAGLLLEKLGILRIFEKP